MLNLQLRQLVSVLALTLSMSACSQQSLTPSFPLTVQEDKVITVKSLDGFNDAINLANELSVGPQKQLVTIKFAEGVKGAILKETTSPRLYEIKGKIKIVGPGAREMFISGKNEKGIFIVKGELEIENIGITNGSTSGSNITEYGAAIHVVETGIVKLKQVLFLSNKVNLMNKGEGGAIFNLGQLVVNDCEFYDNYAQTGSAISNRREAMIKVSNFMHNISLGSTINSQGSTTMESNTVGRNIGGGIRSGEALTESPPSVLNLTLGNVIKINGNPENNIYSTGGKIIIDK